VNEAECAILCHSLCVQTAQQTLISNVTCHIKQGHITGIIGPNGAGKSTLLKTIVGLIPLTKGRCSIFGEDCCQPSTRRFLAFLPEKFYVTPALTGRDFLKVTSQFSVPEQWDGLCEILDFAPSWLNKPVKLYSKGMLQKLGLIYLLASNRPLLIADELMSGLDIKTRTVVHSYMRLLRHQKRTILFSTHMPYDILDLCDQAILLEHGAIEFAGQAHRLPAYAFTGTKGQARS
jgi:ABC-2 type transport system ATP-binding protein